MTDADMFHVTDADIIQRHGEEDGSFVSTRTLWVYKDLSSPPGHQGSKFQSALGQDYNERKASPSRVATTSLIAIHNLQTSWIKFDTTARRTRFRPASQQGSAVC
jgi:hypothetical protein